MNADTRVTLGGISFSPQSLTCAIQAVDYDSGRTADGKMHRNMVATKYKYQVKLAPMHSNDKLEGVHTMSDLLAAMGGAEFQFSAPDPMDASSDYSGTFYVGDRTIPVYNFKLDIWDSMSFDVIEV